MNADQMEERHNILDSLIAEFLADHPGQFASEISAIELLRWYYGKAMKEQEKELKSQQHEMAIPSTANLEKVQIKDCEIVFDDSPVIWEDEEVENIEEQKPVPVPETCGTWSENECAGRMDGERGSVAWSAPYDSGSLIAMTICPKEDIDGVGGLYHSFTRVTHPTGLNAELAALAELFGFDWEKSLSIAQGL